MFNVMLLISGNVFHKNVSLGLEDFLFAPLVFGLTLIFRVKLTDFCMSLSRTIVQVITFWLLTQDTTN